MRGTLLTDYGTPTRLVVDISDDAAVVSSTLGWLLRRQNKRGYWGMKTELGRIVSTCQTVMTLVAYHFPTESDSIKRALAWLKTDKVRNSEYGYWRVSPLVTLGEGSAELAQAIERVATLYKSGHKFNPNFIFALYYHNLLHRIGMDRENSDLAEVESRLIAMWTAEACWNNRADNTAWAYCSLENAGSSHLDAQIKSSCVSLLKQRATRIGTGHVCWEGSVVATAFVVMNIMSCSFREDSDLFALCQEATDWLLWKARANKPPHWKEDREVLPAGGEVYDSEYVTAVALRAIVAGRSVPEQAHISQIWLAERRRLISQLKYWRSTAVVLGSLAFFLVAVPYLWSAYKAGAWAHMWHLVVVLIAGIVTLGDLYGIYKLVRGWIDPT